MTPPLTPHDTEMNFERHTDFQTYMRAFHPYQPDHYQRLTTVTLPLNRGDVILIHSVHSNGWADGTLLVSGARGWLPTNYCEGYDSEPIRNLMKALTVFWDLIKGSNVGGLVVFRNSDYVRGLVAGVRCLLTRTNCLNRESNLIQSHDGLRMTRKALMADLSAFVKVAEALKTFLINSGGDLEVELDLNEMFLKAFKMVNRAVKFLDIWEEHMQNIDASVIIDDAKSMRVPPTPPAEQAQFRLSGNSQEIASNAHNAQANNREEQTRVRPRYSRSSQTFVRPGSSNSFGLANRQSTSHRTSCTVHPVSRNLASEKLTALHNGFITSLGCFIGLHMQSRLSAEIRLTTEQSVVSCRDMLRLVEEIWERDWRRSVALQEAHDNMYEKIADLADAAKDIYKCLRSGEDGDTLVYAATACVRAAGECVAESQFVIERIGDFELESFGLGILDLESVARTAENPIQVVEDQRDLTAEHLIIPPEPLSKPPPPPSKLADQDLPVVSAMSASTSSLDYSSNAALVESTETGDRSSAQLLLPPLPPFTSCLLSYEDQCSSPPSDDNVAATKKNNEDRTQEDSLGVSSSFDSSTYVSSTRDSEPSVVSQSSTRATSPDATFVTPLEHPSLNKHETGGQCALFGDGDEDEAKILEITFAHELVYNREGHISGGTLPALIERLTTHDSTPDATFVSTFYLTFRLFATPTAFAQALIDRFQYVGESPHIAGPVRLRVYNVFKGWLESHWRNDCDNSALELIVPFAKRQLQIVLPTAGKRLATLASKVTAANGPLVPRLISSIGKTNTSIALYVPPDTPLPTPIITKSQLAALKNWKHGGAGVSILDFDPLELARQFTIKESQIFCSILPEELLATEWMKKSGSMAVNVRAMSRLSTDLTNLVTDYILQLEDPKKRAIVIKQWVKIGNKLLELANYDSLFAVICSLESSTILRLKRTWELVSSKTKATLEHLKSVVDISKNYVVLRQRLQNHVPPCLPFVGTYLTDLTFVDIGNQTTRQLPGEGLGESKSVINFDKHMKTAKIISELQRFQIPYRFIEIPELQTWMQDQLVRVRTSDESSMQNHYRRSLILEPRDQVQCKSSPIESQASFSSTKDKFDKDKFEFFGLGWSYHTRHHSRDKTVTRPTTPS